MSRRTERIAEQLRAEISQLLRREVSDPRIGLVTLTRVDVAPDLSNAVVYYSVMGEDDPASVESNSDVQRQKVRSPSVTGSRRTCAT